MHTLRLQFYLLLLQFTSHIHGQLSDLRRCADPQCQKVIAEARTTVRYPSGHNGVLSFPNNAVVKIYSKEAGSNLDWWGVEINGKRGYAPKKFLREDRVLVSDELLQHVVPVDQSSFLLANARNGNTIDEKIDKVDKLKAVENLTADDDDEADGGEEFYDEEDADEGEEGLEGIQVYNAGANSPSNPDERPTLASKASIDQPSPVEAKSEEQSPTDEGQFSVSADDASMDISPSNVDFEVVDGTTIFGDPLDVTPTPPYLPDYETPPPFHSSITETIQATTATPSLSSSADIMTSLPEDGSTTPELQVVPSGLPASSSSSREATVLATPVPVLPESSAVDAISSVVHLEDKTSPDIDNPRSEPSSDTSSSKATSFDEDLASDIMYDSASPAFEVNDMGLDAISDAGESNSPPAGDGSPALKRDPVPLSSIVELDSSLGELSTDHIVEEVLHNNFDSLTNSGIGINSQTVELNSSNQAVEESFGNQAVVKGSSNQAVEEGLSNRAVEEGSSNLAVEEGSSDPAVEEGSSDPVVEKGSSDPAVKKGSSNQAVGDGSSNHAVEEGLSDLADAVLKSDDHTSDARLPTPGSGGDDSADVPEISGGGIFDGWLSSWSSAEDDSDVDVVAPENPSEDSGSQLQPGEQSDLDEGSSYGDEAVDTQNSVGEVSFNSAADQATTGDHSSNSNTTTDLIATTSTEAATMAGASNEGSDVVQQSAGHSDVGGAVSGSESASHSVAAGDAEVVAEGGSLGDFTSSSPVPHLGDANLNFGTERLDTYITADDNVHVATNSPEPVIGASESMNDVSGLHSGTSEPNQKTSEFATEDILEPDASELANDEVGLINAPEATTEASASINGDSVLGSSIVEPMLDMSNSADQLLSEEMVSSSSDERPADISDVMTDPSGEAMVGGSMAPSVPEPDAPDTLVPEPASDASDLHDPESLTGHLLKTVEPIILFLTGSAQLGESLSLALEHDLSSPVPSSGALAAVVILALTILLLYVTSALISKCSREGPLLKALNVLEHEQHTAEQFIADLQRKLSVISSQGGSPVEVVDNTEARRVLAELQQAQEENSALLERVQDLEQQLEESTSSGLEMDNMLQELLHSQKDTASFQEAIDSLQQMLDSQREKVESLTADLSIKTTLNEELRGESATAKERIRKLEYQLDQVTQSLEEVNSAKAQVATQLAAEQGRLQQVTEERDALGRSSSEASAALAALTEQHSSVQSKTHQLRSTLKTKEAELHVTKECLKQLKAFNNDGKAAKEKLAQLLDSVKARSELACAVEERRSLEAELQQRSDEVVRLERRLQQVQQEAEQCRNDQTAADHEKREALSKLAVLADYFHEKEAQLTKELESESGLRLDAEGSAESITSRIRDYDMQLLAYKTQVNTLKKELEDQELSFKTQLAAQEQKAHESWVSARAAERKYEESKQETAQMRSRLLLMSKDNSEQQHAIIKPTLQHVETSNGSVSSPRPPLHDDLDGEHSHPLDSPPPIPPPHVLPHLFPPPPNLPPGMPPPFPPPPHFLPPPLPPPMMADRRLPPAGRLASPPFHRRMGAASPPEFLDRRSPPHFDRRSYSPASERSRYSDRQGRYSPDRHGRYSPDRHGRYSPDRQGRYSPDRQGRYSPDRQRRYSPDRLYDRHHHHHHHSDRYNNIDRHSDAYSSNGRNDSQRDSSPERPYNRSPEGFARKVSPPPLHRRLYDEGSGPPTRKGKKTSTPLGPNDR